MNENSAYVNKDIELNPTSEGNLTGLTFSTKDVIAIRDYTNGAGNPDWLLTHQPAEKNAPVIDKLLKSGATLKGTTVTDEMMYSLNGENYFYGTPLNPKAPDRIPGGSSSGSASAVATDVVDFALGTDTGGSVRIPSAYCGLYGFRPTHDVFSMEGVIPLAQSFDTVGWMSKNPDKMLKIGDVLLENQIENKTIRRVIIPEEAWALLDGEVTEALSDVLPLFKNIGQTTDRTTISDKGLATWADTFRVLQGMEIWTEHGGWIEAENPTFGPGIAERFAWASTLYPEEHKDAFLLQKQVKDHLSSILAEDNVIVIPTTPGKAPQRNLSNEELNHRRAKTMQLTCIAGLGGLPQVTIPMTEVDGVPVGISIIANRFQDKKLLQAVTKIT
ncbi:amidase [Salibacterium salarium]|uniref:Amidase n=1 Tax=Salibacterium salarium TaxID=284579 RepID=A0A3R9QLT0_9BACI|nr:amidase [Salibacterium salarium]RSL33662.1 amidase [Salibacterium salarium]